MAGYTVNCEHPTQRALVRIWNRAASLRGMSDDEGYPEPSRLQERAARATGLDDFGPDTYIEPMNRLAAALRATANLHPFGRHFATRMFSMGLTNRLRIQDEWKRRPEAADTCIERPIFILGMPRTGTTHLFSLLACDPNHRTLTNWEARTPVPPRRAFRRAVPVRRLGSRFALGFFKYLAPSYDSIYPLRVDGPEECGPLAINEFTFPLFHEMFDVPDYIDWINTHDFRPLMRYHRKQFQLLELQRPGYQWVIKSPYLVAALPALFEVYPDAFVVQLHRDPAQSVPSVCSMWASFRGISSAPLDPAHIGRQVLETLQFDLARGAADRATLDASRFLDVHFDDLAADPLHVVRRIYDAAERALTVEAESNMRAMLAERPSHTPGTHRYSLGQFDLDESSLRRVFKKYNERFNVGHSSLA